MDEEDNTPLCKIEIDEDDMERQSETGETVRKKSKATTSHCWRYFTKIRVGKDGKERAKCNGCNKIFVCGGRKYGTSHLNRHVMKCDKVKTEDIGQMMLDMQGKVEEKKIDQVVHRELLCELIVRHHLPYEFVEYPDLRDWISYLCPDAVMVSRNTIKADIERMYRKERRMLKDLLVSVPSRICLTANLWTPINTKGFLSLTAHFVDLNWKLNSKLLNFCRMPFPYTGFELFKKVYELLQDWGIEKKIFSITLDNAFANDVLQNTLRSQLLLQNGLICGGEFFHIRCCAHILNLIVQEGLSVLGNGLDQIRTSIKYVKGSETRMLKFKQCLQRFFSELDTSCGLCLDVPARWNSTYLMLKSALKYRHVFGSLHLVDESYKYCPSEEEWERVEKICRFLLPFYDITTLISVTSYPTSNLYFLQVWKIQCLLMENMKDEDEVIKNMAELMMVKFEKYWDEYSVVLAFGAILDPRMKLEILAFCFEKIDPLNWELNLGKIKEKLYKLFAEYNNKGLPTPSNVQRHKHGQSSSSSAFIPGLFDVSCLFLIYFTSIHLLAFPLCLYLTYYTIIGIKRVQAPIK